MWDRFQSRLASPFKVAPDGGYGCRPSLQRPEAMLLVMRESSRLPPAQAKSSGQI
jgi:hypothetical protein